MRMRSQKEATPTTDYYLTYRQANMRDKQATNMISFHFIFPQTLIHTYLAVTHTRVVHNII